MPIYEYRCTHCDNVFSHLFLRIPDAEVQQTCPSCGSEHTQRQLSLFACGGKANADSGPSAWPTSWHDTNGGDPETLRYWRKKIEREAKSVEDEVTARGDNAHPMLSKGHCCS